MTDTDSPPGPAPGRGCGIHAWGRLLLSRPHLPRLRRGRQTRLFPRFSVPWASSCSRHRLTLTHGHQKSSRPGQRPVPVWPRPTELHLWLSVDRAQEAGAALGDTPVQVSTLGGDSWNSLVTCPARPGLWPVVPQGHSSLRGPGKRPWTLLPEGPPGRLAAVLVQLEV